MCDIKAYKILEEIISKENDNNVSYYGVLTLNMNRYCIE